MTRKSYTHAMLFVQPLEPDGSPPYWRCRNPLCKHKVMLPVVLDGIHREYDSEIPCPKCYSFMLLSNGVFRSSWGPELVAFKDPDYDTSHYTHAAPIAPVTIEMIEEGMKKVDQLLEGYAMEDTPSWFAAPAMSMAFARQQNMMSLSPPSPFWTAPITSDMLSPLSLYPEEPRPFQYRVHNTWGQWNTPPHLNCRCVWLEPEYAEKSNAEVLPSRSAEEDKILFPSEYDHRPD